MRPTKLLRILACAAVPGLAGNAPAQSWSDPGVGFGGFVSLSDGASAEASTFGGGFHLRYRLTASLGLEGRLGYRQETVHDGQGPLLDVVDLPVMGTGQLFFFPRTRVQPFLLAGAGLHVVRTTPRGRNPDTGRITEALFAMHAGAGLDVRPSRRSALHADARWVFFEPTAVSDLRGAGYDVSSGYLWVSLGVTFFR